MKTWDVVTAYTQKDQIIWQSPDASRFTSPATYEAFVEGHRTELIATGPEIVSATEQGKFTRLIFRGYQERLDWRTRFQDIALLEADVSPIQRKLSDFPFRICKPRRFFYDLESDSDVPIVSAIEGNARILSIAGIGDDGREWSGCIERDTDEEEARLLNEYFSIASEYDQVCGWNSDHFDEPVIRARCRRLKIWPPRRLLWLDQMAAFKRMNLQTAKTGEEKQSFGLNSVAVALLKGEGKLEFDASQTKKVWRAGGEERDRMVRYNLQDAKLLPKIEAATGYLDAHLAICQTCHVFQNSAALKPMKQMDGYLLRMAAEEKRHLPSRPEHTEEVNEQFEGALVMPPVERGIFENVHVLDFSAMYPSLIQTFNLSPETKDEKGKCVALTDIRFRTDVQGVLPKALFKFAELRKVWKDKKKLATPGSADHTFADRQQNVFKVLMNSLYGLLGSPYFRLGDKDIALSVTKGGQWCLQLTMDAAKERGFRPIYADTDGVYMDGASYEQVAEFTEWLNKVHLPAKAAERGCVTNTLNIEWQETFQTIVFPLGDDLWPSSKRYCARFSVYAGKHLPPDEIITEVKGLEIKRGDASRLARRLQQTTVDMLLGGERDPAVYTRLVEQWRHDITQGHLEVEDIAISKGVKDLDQYATGRTLPAHVRIAELLRARGENPHRVSYIILDADATPAKIIPVSDYTGECDRRHLWNNVVYPATLRLLAGAFSFPNWNSFLIKRPKHKVLPGQLSLI